MLACQPSLNSEIEVSSNGTIPTGTTWDSLVQVSLPSSILGAANADPRAKALHEELAEVNKKILSNQPVFVPEHERSPSPEPVYDGNGLRLNTREIRAKDKLMQKRSSLIEELIKADPGYRPPADYR